MILFKTTAEQVAKLPEIVCAMIKVGVADLLIAEAAELAKDDQGVFELMELWIEEPSMRDVLLQDIQDSINDCKKPINVYTIDVLDQAMLDD